MIHLDHHHKVLPAWDPLPPHDDAQSFNPDNFLSDSPKPASNFSAQPDNPNPQSAPSSLPGPVTAADANDHTSPPPTADGNTASPTGEDRSSSLSPPPESGSPQTHNGSVSSPAPPPTTTEDNDAEKQKPSSIAIKTGLEQSSRQSTPLSEPPDQEDDADSPADNLKEGMPEESSGAEVSEANEASESKPPESGQNINGTASKPSADGGESLSDSRLDTNTPSSWNNDSLTKTFSGTTNDPNSILPSPVAPSPTSSISQGSDPKVMTVLELNAELLKVFMEFQSRGMQVADPIPSQYFARLQSNLAWLAAAADQSRQGNHSNISLPMMDPPAPVDFTSIDRIRQLYAELPTVFAKEMARRQQAVLSSVNAAASPSTPNPSNHLKRDRPHDTPTNTDPPNIKRRDTGESKPNFGPSPQSPAPPNNYTNNMNASNPMQQTPTPNQFGMPMANGAAAGVSPQGTPSFNNTGSLGTNVVNTAEAQLAATNRDRARQAQIRAAQQLQMQQQQQAARQMSPPAAPGMANPQMPVQPMQNSGMNPPGSSNAGSNNVNPAAGAMTPNFQAMYQILQTPNHPFVQYMVRHVSGFAALPLQAQLQKMMMAQAALQQHKEQRMSNMGSGGMSPTATTSTNLSGQQFPGQNISPISPVTGSPSIPQGAQNAGFQMGNISQSGMDPRSIQIPPGMNVNNLSAQQRQLYLLQQQSRGAGVGGAGANNPQAMMIALQHQERLRQMGQQAGSPNIGSPMAGNMPDISSLRSNSTIPGIARSARSPSDNTPSPMTPRVPTRGSSMGQEDYQRMMMAQQAQANRAMSTQSPAGFSQQSLQAQGSWQQNQIQQQQQNMGNQGGSGYVMSPGSAQGGGYGGAAASPSAMQNWQQQGGGYPFAPSPGGSMQSEHPQTPRHMSATPVPQQIQPQNSNTQSESSMVASNDFDLLNWSQ